MSSQTAIALTLCIVGFAVAAGSLIKMEMQTRAAIRAMKAETRRLNAETAAMEREIADLRRQREGLG